MANRMTVYQNQAPIYDIVLEHSFEKLGEEVEKLFVKDKRICIVTDSNVAPLYLQEVTDCIAPLCSQVISYVFPAGEERKNLDTVRDLYETLIQKKFDRHDLLLALGGGVVGDLCGFAAATYLRGISFIQVPTTLLSQVDSSIGGKTGVDFASYKNMVGAFHMPLLVYANISTLLTLTDEQFSAGMGEVVKHGLIKDREYYEWLGQNAGEIWGRDLSLCEQMVIVSNQIKKDVVEKDPTEKGDRALLNFGHTLGHAVEKLKDFQLLHGHCVGLGALAAACLSAGRGLISMEEVDGIRDTYQKFHVPVTVGGLKAPEIIEATKNDKKMDAGVIKFVLLSAVGDAYTDKTVSEDEMRQALGYILE